MFSQKRRYTNTKGWLGSLGMFFLMSSAQAGNPLWTFSPLTPTTVSVPTGSTATIEYKVTNQSRKTHTLRMKPIVGVIPSGCTTSLGYHQSCTLSLSINGSALKGNIVGGPVLCEQGNPNQCYRPSRGDQLHINIEAKKS